MFKRVHFDIKVTSVEDVAIGSKHVIVRVNGCSSQVYGWGCYSTDNEDYITYQPKQLEFFSGADYQIHKIVSGRSYTSVYVTRNTEEGDEKPYFISGKFEPFEKETKQFSNKDFKNTIVENCFMKYERNGDRLYISTGGQHVPGQAFELDAKPDLQYIIKSDGEHKVTDAEGANTQNASFVTLKPIDNLADKTWPDLEELVDSEAAETSEFLYYALNDSKNVRGLT